MIRLISPRPFTLIALYGIAAATPCWSAGQEAKNQATAAQTVILPANDDAGGTARPSLARSIGDGRLTHVAIVDASVDPDGCMTAPLSARYPEPASGQRTAALEAIATTLRDRGVTVDLVAGGDLQAIDAAGQARLKGLKGSYRLSFGDGAGRWFATRVEMVACAQVDADEDQHRRRPHAALAAMLAALHQDVVLAIGESEASSKGPSWNIIEGELSSSGKSLDSGTSSAKVAAMLVLKDGSVPWSGEATAEGALRSPFDEQAVASLKAYMEGEMRKMEAYRVAHPDADGPPPGLDEHVFDAIASGDLEQAPIGSTLGPSAAVTLQAAVDRLLDQLWPVLPGEKAGLPAPTATRPIDAGASTTKAQ